MKTSFKMAFAATIMIAGVIPVKAQSFANAYFFGDSLTDCCAFGRTTNSKAPNLSDQLPPAIGASYTAMLRTNGAVSGAQSGTGNVVAALDGVFGAPTGFLPQVARFTAQGQAIGPRDIAGIWIGTNDIYPSAQTTTYLRQPLGVQPTVSALTDYIAGNVRTGINTLVAQGFRNLVLVAPYDLAKSEAFAASGSDSPAIRALATQYSEAYRDRLATLYTPGVNTYFLDTLTLLRRVQADPARYGFDVVTTTASCSVTPSCSTAPVEVQNRYVFNDVIHVTSGFDRLMANYIANIINARSALPVQGDLSQGVGTAFSGILLNRLDAFRRANTPMVLPGQYAADLPGRPAPPSPIPVMLGSPVSIFAEGAYAGLDRNARATPNGPSTTSFGADFAGVTTGIEYRATPSVLVGAAFNYFNTSTELRRGLGSIDLDSFQGGLFASYSTPNLFADGAFTYGSNSFGIRRPGVVDTLTASPDGNTLTVAGKVGYLFDFSNLRVGPIAELTYANVHLGSYRERGDSLLTLGVRNQDFDGLTGGAGLQARTVLPIFGGLVSPFLNLTAQHDFLDGVRTVTSFSTNAPALLINTGAGHRGDDVYGKVAGGFSVDFSNGLSGGVSGSTTFGRSYGDDYTVSVGLRYRL